MTTPPGPTWVVGSRGLLGGAVTRALQDRGAHVLTTRVPWSDPEAAVTALDDGLASVLDTAGAGPWNLAWCAGSGVTSTSGDALDREVATIGAFVDRALARTPDELAQGAVFLASSAGGVYAGAAHPPFDETTVARPLAPYGAAKLRAEAELARLASSGGARVLVGRISNLYGPGQDLDKAQGLISQISRAQLLVQPIGVYVSLDTVRDYLYVDDAAAMVCDGLVALRERTATGDVVTKILASQRSASIAAVLGEFRRVAKRRQLVRLAASPQASQQARDLRFRSVVWPDLDERALVPLPAGILATVTDIRMRIGAGELSALSRRD
ncbi:NAD-dependent epimerase/dehydratase family protein [Cellulomonas sp. NPDC055163]